MALQLNSECFVQVENCRQKFLHLHRTEHQLTKQTHVVVVTAVRFHVNQSTSKSIYRPINNIALLHGVLSLGYAILTVRITKAFGLPKLSLFCNVQIDVASLN